MCGITGFFSPTRFPNLIDHLPRATDSLADRGPDDRGIYQDDRHGIGLGHRRLSIIDLSAAGRQPMEDADGRVIVYNGEVYNFSQIRSDLIARGYRFSSQSDTEVILAAFRQWGSACLDKLIGMFALAIWDRPHQQLFLARDRLGIKPLYYHVKGDTLIFGSELKALMAFQQFPRGVDEQSLSLFLHYQYVPGPRTIFKDTFKLMPGNFLTMDAGRPPVLQSYWRLPTPGRSDLDETEQLDTLDDLLTRAVADRLVSDVPLGALLSGGIDSSLVAALMQKCSPRPIRTFSIGFSEEKYNEAPWAARVARHLGTNHTEMVAHPRHALDLVPQLPQIYDEPFADSSAIPTLLVSRLTRTQVTVALSGDGGDEQFAGYVRYWMAHSLGAWFNRMPSAWPRLAASCLGAMPASWLQRLYQPLRKHAPQRFQVDHFTQKWRGLLALMGAWQVSEFYRATICLWDNDRLQTIMPAKLSAGRFEALFVQAARWPIIDQLMHVDQGTYLPDGMLTKVDRASMAHGLEVRAPLLDHRVLAFTSQMPASLKYRDGQGKYLLKKLLARYVPRQLVNRPKMGFAVPLADWLRGPLKPLLTDYLSDSALHHEGRFDKSAVARMLDAFFKEGSDDHYRLWALLMWQLWRKQWLG